jgi:cell division septum initiation protein DivIVA
MSDIVEDSKVHYIVKDYKRMYEGFHTLVKENKDLRKMVDELQKKVEHLHSELDKKEKIEAKKKIDGAVKGMLNDSMCQIYALHNKAKQFIEQTERITKTIEQLDKEIRITI